ncbi:MAG: SDR family NAD(P)-dependent oxidoreductase, partial [Rhodospirillaceae bacterium]
TSLLEQARKTLAKGLNAGQRIVSLGADVSSKADVEKIVATALTEFGRIDVLVNNAGIYGPKGPIDEIDWPEWVKAIEINLYGSILMTRGVLPSMKKAGSGKIVQLSGGGATNPLPCISAYAVSKAGIIRFVETVAEEVRQYNVHVNAIAPGALNTKMLDEVLEAGPEKVGRAFYERSVKQKERGGAPLERGAALAVYLGSSLSDGITGKLISAMWDPWESLDEHRAELDGTDVYTLRRIVPRDRGMTWGNDA